MECVLGARPLTHVCCLHRYRVNAWGFNSYDQVTIPFFVFPALILIDLVPLFRRCVCLCGCVDCGCSAATLTCCGAMVWRWAEEWMIVPIVMSHCGLR